MKYLIIIILIFTPLVTHGALVDNLQGCWELDEASGTRADSSDNGNTLADNNTVGQGAAIVAGNSADYERDNNEWLDIADASQTGLDITSDMSFSGWYNSESETNQQELASKFRSDGNTNKSWLARGDWSSNSLSFYNSSSGVGEVGSGLSVTLNTATAYHIVMVYDASAGSTEVFVDNSSIGTISSLATSMYNSSAPFAIGKSQPGESGGQVFDGLIDVFAIWDKTLTTDEISDLYASGSGIDCDTITTPAAAEGSGIFMLMHSVRAITEPFNLI